MDPRECRELNQQLLRQVQNQITITFKVLAYIYVAVHIKITAF